MLGDTVQTPRVSNTDKDTLFSVKYQSKHLIPTFLGGYGRTFGEKLENPG